MYDAIADDNGQSDPFVAEKARANELALSLVPRFRALLESARDSVRAAVQFSIAGNSMDLGVVRDYGDVGALAEVIALQSSRHR